MSNAWERFEGIVSAEEVVEAKNAFSPTEAGDYTVILHTFEVGENKDNLPSIKCRFMREDKKLIFADLSLQLASYPGMTAMLVNRANTFTNDILETDVEFTTLGELAERVGSATIGDAYKLNVNYEVNKKTNVKSTYATITILEKLENIPF